MTPERLQQEREPFRGSVFTGWVLIAVCVVLMIVYPSARPGWGFWVERAVIGVAVGALLGLTIQLVVPREKRVAATRRLTATGRRRVDR
jgi:hypothetical protein